MADAKKLIEENLRTQDPYLDLGNCGLDGTEPELEQLAECTHLETLIFSNEWYDEMLSSLLSYLEEASPRSGRDTYLLPKVKREIQSILVENQRKKNDLNQMLSFLLSYLQEASLRGGRDAYPLRKVKREMRLILKRRNRREENYLNQIPETLPIYLNKLILGGDNGWSIRDLSPLLGLTNLQYLDLTHNQIQDASPLSGLTNLQHLGLSHNQIQDASPLSGLTNLQHLGLSHNQIQDASPLSGLVNLKELFLENNEIYTIPDFVNLEKLEVLDIANNHIADVGTHEEINKGMKGIKQVINDNQLNSQGANSFLESYARYESNKQEFIEIIGQKEILSEPNISGYILDSGVLYSPQFIIIRAFANNHSIKFKKQVDEYRLPVSLKELDISDNYLTKISFLLENKNLQSLKLGDNLIKEIPLNLLDSLPNLTALDIGKNPIENIPREIVTSEDQGGGAVLDYLRSIRLEEDRRELNEAKVIFVGVGEVGKTELTEAISASDYRFTENRPPTIGIRVKRWKPKGCKREGEDIDFTANVWDFAGQEINYGTHQFFLTKNSIYIFVWETRKGEGQSKFGYWLNIVSLLSGNAPIFVVQNKIDILESEINQKDWKNKFPHIVDFYKTSCKTGKGISRLNQDIKKQLLAIPHTREIWNRYRFAVRRALEEDERDYISYHQYLDICTSQGLDPEEASFLSRQLHDIGVILYFEQDIAMRDTVVLNATWATDAAYSLLDGKKIKEGKFQVSELDKIWRDERFKGKHVFLLSLMKRFELVFQLHESDKYIVPELLPVQIPQGVEDAYEQIAESSDRYLRFEYHYDFMPKGILSRFICRSHELIDKELFWKYGVVLSYEGSKAYIVLNDVETIKTIKIEAGGNQADKLLYTIRMHFDHIHKSLKNPPVKEKVPCVCPQTCEYKRDPYLHNYDTLRKFQGKGKKTRECEKSGEDISIASMMEGIRDTGEEIFFQDGEKQQRLEEAYEDLSRWEKKYRLAENPNKLMNQREQDLLENLRESYELLADWEGKYRIAENPGEEKRSEKEINKLKRLIQNDLAELAQIRGTQAGPSFRSRVMEELEGIKASQQQILSHQEQNADLILAKLDTVIHISQDNRAGLALIFNKIDQAQLEIYDQLVEKIDQQQIDEMKMMELLVEINKAVQESKSTEVVPIARQLQPASGTDLVTKFKLNLPLIPFLMSVEQEMDVSASLAKLARWWRERVV